MKPAIFTLVLIATFSQLTLAQPVETIIKSQAIEMGKAMVTGDTKTFSSFMLPELVNAGGGADKVLKLMDTAFSIFRQFGGKVSRITYGNPVPVVAFKKELQTFLPQTTELTSSLADITLTSTIVAISRDKGKHWYFYDASLAQAKEIKDKLPPLSPSLQLPPPVKPTITPKQEMPR